MNNEVVAEHTNLLEDLLHSLTRLSSQGRWKVILKTSTVSGKVLSLRTLYEHDHNLLRHDISLQRQL